MPTPSPIPSAARRALQALVTLAAAMSAVRAQDVGDAVVSLPALATAAALDPSAGGTTFALRVAWGGGRPQRYSGSISVSGPDRATPDRSAAPDLDWRFLSSASLATTRVTAAGRTLHLRQTTDCIGDEIEILLPDHPATRVTARLAPLDRAEEAVEVSCTLAELIGADVGTTLDTESNRLTLRRAPGDAIRVVLDGGAVRRPGETIRLGLHALLPHQGGGGAHELRIRVRDGAEGDDSYAHTWILHEAGPRPGDRVDAPPRRFEPISVDVPLPAREGAWDIVMEVTERGGLRWTRPLATRVVQVVTVSESPTVPEGDAEWRVIHELDPTSPKLLERLRRLPVVGRGAAALPQMSLPKVPLPSVPFPSVPLPSVPLPRMPSVAAVVPRFTGLLATGHSVLESHPSGAVFRLPPARSDEEPAWEAIQVAGAAVGAPHRLEISIPVADPAVVSITVLEQVGGTVVVTFEGGFAVDGVAGSTATERHGCTFWPQTRSPVVVLGNPSLRRPLSFGTVRLLAGPTRLSPRAGPVPSGTRAVWGVVDDPGLAGFGGPWRVDGDSGRAAPDWRTVLGAAKASAEWFASQGAAGALVTVHADGAPAWPVRHAPPFGRDQSTADVTLDPEPKDILEVLCRTYGRQGMKVVPALRAGGPLEELESLLVAESAANDGLLCLGRDGRPPRGDPGRYNILDPRVQDAVETLLLDLASRVAAHGSVDGLAIIVAHDGWFHLPGTAWGLDDTTFARFLADTPEASAALAAAGPEAFRGDETRFALRATLVEGTLREAWLEWRSGVVADFVGRLATRLARAAPGRSLSVVPTTLFTTGDLAARFRPVLAGTGDAADVCREIGLDAARLTAHPGVVWVSPHVHAATDDFVERETIDAANRSPALRAAAAAARRRAAITVESAASIDLRGFLAQGVLTGSAPAGAVAVHAVRTGVRRDRAFAEIQAAADCERVYDGALARRAVDDADLERIAGLASLPVCRMETVPGAPAPLVVRSGRDDERAALSVTNAAGVRCRALVDASDSATPGGPLVLDLGPWQTRVVTGIGPATLRGVSLDYDASVAGAVREGLAGLRRRRAALEMPVPMAVIDNPSFELPDHAGDIPGWELLERGRGHLGLVPGAPAGTGRALAFSSDNGLATLRSNPFPPPATGRVSVALWMRVDGSAGPPPLRIAVEGVYGGREYYRFAPVGVGPGAKPLSGTWSHYVLQVDDLPGSGMETLRVRLDLLAGGSVQIDDVRVFDLAFDEAQRVQLSRALGAAEARLAAGDVGGCIEELETHWPRFLATFVSDEAADRALRASADAGWPADGGAPAPPPRTGILDRVRRLWK